MSKQVCSIFTIDLVIVIDTSFVVKNAVKLECEENPRETHVISEVLTEEGY
ncbi:hypothetical protein [Nostoc sp.]|uniref:hypothetical protein n=1 Tax=Nostoc sp. TaxID=1180 RepID=UPI002FFB40D4